MLFFSIVCVLLVVYVHVCVGLYAFVCGGQRLVWVSSLISLHFIFSKQSLPLNLLIQIGCLAIECQGSTSLPPLCQDDRCAGPCLALTLMPRIQTLGRHFTDCPFPWAPVCPVASVCTYLSLKLGVVFVFRQLLS